MYEPTPQIETRNLMLRPPSRADLDRWAEVIHCIAAGNAASQAVARRLGSKRLRQQRLPPPLEHVEVDIWGQTRAQWQAQRDHLPLRVA